MLQIFLTFFKTLEGKEVIVELKNDLIVKGKLLSVDQFLNMKLDSISVVDAGQFPQLVRERDCAPAETERRIAAASKESR